LNIAADELFVKEDRQMVWHVCFDALERRLAGATPSGAPGERWQEVHASYVAGFRPEGATIGPPQR
jgi:hypothetical protein